MKYLVVLLVIVLVIWLARASRRAPPLRREGTKKPEALEDMVSCAQCGLHLPRSEALPGLGGFFCGAAHRAEHERELEREP
jgi:uncharacterized protein